MKKVAIDPFTLIWLTLIIYVDGGLLIPLVCAIFLHELGHVAAALAIGAKIKRITLMPIGANLEISDSVSYTKELLISAAGPLMGLLGSLISLSLRTHSDGVIKFAYVSILLSLFNLLPISTFDGGRILKCLLCCIFSLDFSEEIIKITSFACLFAFWLISVYFLIKFAGGISGFVFCLIFFVKSFVINDKK